MNAWISNLLQKKYTIHVAVFLMVLLACFGIMIGNGVYPFGDYCMLHIDMYHQYCPFFAEFLDKLQNQDSLLYTWNLGLGSDYISLYAYYLASPFNWLLILWPKAYVIEFMELSIVLKMAIGALGFYMFAKKLFPVEGKDGRLHGSQVLPAVLCAFTYAFSGFVAAYNWDIMWMDCIALFPFIMLGLYQLVNENKVVLYYVSLALSVWANYYISIMICIFLCIYFVYIWVRQSKGKLQSFGRFAWYSILAGGTSAVLLLPEIYVLGYSGSSGINFPDTMEWYFNLISELSRANAFAYVYTGRDHWPNLYSGAFTLLLVVLYFFNRKITWREKAPRLVLLCFFFISFANNDLDFIWHGFHFPDSLPGRQSFLFTFVVLMMALEVMRKWKGNRNWHILVAMGILATELILGYLFTDSEVTDWFSFVITGTFVAVYAICFFLIRMSDRSNRVFYRNLAFLFALIEVIGNMAATGFGVTSRTEYMAKYQDYETLLEEAEENEGEDSFYRVEDLERHTKNDDSLYGYASATQFSSLMNINVSHFYQKIGMEGGKNFYCYNGATPLLTSMLSVKYQLTNDSLCEGDLWSLVDTSNDQKLYKYNYSLPLGYMVSEDILNLWNPESTEDVYNINELGYLLGADSDILELMDVNTSAEMGSTSISTILPGYYYAEYSACTSDSLTLNKGDETRTYSKASHKYLLDLGYCDMGDSMTVTNGNGEILDLTIYRVNMDAFEQAYETLNSQTMELTSKTSDSISGTIDVKDSGYLILSVTSEPGWKLYVDGKETDYEDFGDTFIAVNLDQGNHEIQLKYLTPGLQKGGMVSLTCLLLFVISLLIRRFYKKNTPALQEVGPFEDAEGIDEDELAFVEDAYEQAD